jgi:hypothetical protein
MNTGYGMLIWVGLQVEHESEIRVWMGARPAHTACCHTVHDHENVMGGLQPGRNGRR